MSEGEKPMKTEKNRARRGRGAFAAALAAAALAVGLCLASPALDGRAFAAPQDGSIVPAGRGDLGIAEQCSLRLSFPADMEQTPDKDGTVVDMYRIAAAVRIPGYEAFAFCTDNSKEYYDVIRDYVTDNVNFRTQVLSNDPAGENAAGASEWLVFYYTLDDPDRSPVSDWSDLVDLVSERLFGASPLVTPGDIPEDAVRDGSLQMPYTASVGAAAQVPAGLYLTVVHGSDVPQYSEDRLPYIVASPKDKGDPDAGSRICSIAYTDTSLYTFRPQLVSVPGLASGEEEQQSGFIYNVATVCKWEVEPRYASLALQKTVTRMGDPETFVFRVTASDPHSGEAVFDRVLTMTFDGAGSQIVRLLDCIPVGSDVTVAEVYSGQKYTLDSVSVVPGDPSGAYDSSEVSLTEKTIVIHGIRGGIISVDVPGRGPDGSTTELQTGETVTAAFVNNYDGSHSGDGGSVVNSFEFDENVGWSWIKRHFDRESGRWVDDLPLPADQTD